jgi:GNAT superfamily N-acetyltransferase
MEIRRLRAEEWQRWRAMRLDLLKDAPRAFGSTYEETLARPDDSFREHVVSAASSPERAIFVAEEGDRWLACAGGYLEPDEHGQVWLFTVWTRPEARGQGLQRRLGETVMQWARDEGYTTMKLWVTDENDAARACYEKLGFVPNGVRQVMREDITESMMSRPL